MEKNKLIKALSKQLVALIAASSLISCSSTAPVQRDFFVLSPSLAAKTSTISGTPVASISRVTLPSYLNQQNIVRQIDNDKVSILTQQLWAEKLSQAIPAIMASEISTIIKKPIETHPLPPGVHISTRVEINIRQFIATDNQLTLQADYRIIKSEQLLSHRFSRQITLTNSSTKALVTGYNHGLNLLAIDIAKHL